jgi:hypothetical protein
MEVWLAKMPTRFPFSKERYKFNRSAPDTICSALPGGNFVLIRWGYAIEKMLQKIRASNNFIFQISLKIAHLKAKD